MSAQAASPGKTDRLTCLVLAVLLAAFGFLRLAASAGDFYIDEIWSFYFSRQMTSLPEVFKLNHDNNHIFNTLYLYVLGGEPFFLGGRPTFVPHRLLSVISGVVSLFLVWKIASRRGRAEAFTALLLAGFSYPLVLYSSEARGYAPAIMFALASFLFVERRLEGSRPAMFFFWLSAPLAFLSHSSFIYVYAALFVWSALEEARRNGAIKGALRLAQLHIVPVVFAAFYYLLFLKSMVYGGGELGSPFKEVLLTASMALGAPSGGLTCYASLALVVMGSIAGLVRLSRLGPGEPVFYISAIFIVPAIIVAVMKPEFLYFRYFLVCFPFLYLLLAHALCALYERPGISRAVFFALVAAFCALNAKSDIDLVRDGRGSYSEAIEFMVNQTAGDEVVVSGDHDFRNGMVTGFYAGYFKGKRIVYINRDERTSASEWFLAHSVDPDRRAPEFIFDSGSRYSLERSYGFAGVSGWSWFVYRKDAG